MTCVRLFLVLADKTRATSSGSSGSSATKSRVGGKDLKATKDVKSTRTTGSNSNESDSTKLRTLVKSININKGDYLISNSLQETNKYISLQKRVHSYKVKYSSFFLRNELSCDRNYASSFNISTQEKHVSELYVFHFVAVTRKLSITADDQIAELYVDGIATPFAQGGWQVVRTIDIPDETQVIAVKAIDIAKVCSDAEMQCNVRIV